MIKHVFIDLDDTVFDFHRSEREALSNMLTSLGIEPTETVTKRYSEINDAQWKMLERGETTRERLLVDRFDILFKELSKRRDPCEAKRLYEANLSRSFHFIDGAEKMLTELSGRYSLYLASNGTDSVQTGRIAASGIGKYFKELFISERLGYDKPRREYFDACFARIDGFRREECIILGDSMTSDIKGGKNAGILTCLFNPRGAAAVSDVKPDFEIRALCEFLPLIEKIK